MKLVTILVLATSLGITGIALAEDVDLAVVNRIKAEAFNNSQVMNYVHHLADENGPRLASSPEYQRAARWAVSALKEAGIQDAQVVPFGEFGRSWSWSSISVKMLTPHPTSLNGVPLAWSGGTEGAVSGDVVYAPLWEDINDPDQGDLVLLAERIESYKQEYAGKLGGKIILLSGMRPFDIPWQQDSQRWSDDELAEMLTAREPVLADLYESPLLRLPVDTEQRWLMYELIPEEIQEEYAHRQMDIMDRLIKFLNAEKVAAVLMTGVDGNGGAIFAESFGSFRSAAPVPPPAVQLMPEHYNRLVRLVNREVAVSVSVDVVASYPEDHAQGMNVIAELPGSSKRREVVMMGAHLDSWHTGTGATDNATGCAIVMEAMRILNALDLKLDRTVRLGLWDGEEQGHLGSRAYVRQQLGDPVSMKLKPEHDRFSVYYNIDTGSGKTRGVLSQGNDMMQPILAAVMQPFVENGIATIVPRNDWGTDHQAFDAVGLPAFDLLQDNLDYWSHTHHSNLDTVDHVVEQDLRTSAAFMAALIYQAATRKDLMPREDLPQPLPKPRPLPKILQD